MIVVGITGNLASGKSEAARIFKRRGARIFDADQAAKKVVRVGMPAYQAIAKLFGKDYLQTNRSLDRKKIAEHVFSCPRDLKKLNTLIHPAVILECFKTIERSKKKSGILVLDVPLLFESKMENLVHWTVVIDSSFKNIIKRTKKNGLSEKLTRKILATQWPCARKMKHADFVIENNGTLKELEKKVWEVMENIKNKVDYAD
ncbi:MAG: dephospho-CoA kinase [Candidatus Omnitrophica bacterium CG1_02_46_14]|nr:MAG: dephospho-CoA kinase [Candidatus Omnitrophica bacterium CG1_02_46_14]